VTRVAGAGEDVGSIPGDPWALRQFAGRLTGIAAQLADTGSEVAAIGAIRWTGPGAQAFEQVTRQQPGRYRAAAEAIAGAADAIYGYAAALEEAQALSARASVIGAGGSEVDAIEAAGVQALAENQLSEAARSAAAILHAAQAGAPTKPGLWQDVVHSAYEVAVARPVNLAVGVGKGTWSALEGLYQTGSLLTRGTDPFFALLDPSSARHADDTLAGLAGAVAAKPVGFLESAGKGLVDWNEWSRNPARALGGLVPGIAAGLATDGAGDAVAAGDVARGGGVLNLSAKESWANGQTLADHFGRHGPAFSAASPDQYAKMASVFLQTGLREEALIKIDGDGTIRLFDPRTNTFAAFRADGRTKSFYKPKSSTYWSRQPGGVPWPG
jgi:uncharacterized protein YukE